MPYMYRGDYYRGDYYRGDFWGTLGKIGKGVIGGVVGGITGGPGGFVTGAVQGFTGGGGPPRPPGTQIGSPIAAAGRQLVNFFGGGTSSGKGRYAPPGTPGYHPRKHPRPGQDPNQWVRNRHMNPTNVRALRRADRRAHSFLKISRSITKHYVAKAPKGRAYVSARKRKR